ncbi:MAG: 3D domain-containing protein [Candidatus Niyogibacteria bacterium]|nr:3D domain-containing protein [Candidatus Niyogibacteria bacterium]
MVINLLVLASLISGLFPYSAAALGKVVSTAEPIEVQPVETVREVREVWVTAYSSTPEETDDTPLIAASGKTVSAGFMAANFLDFGTRVKIPEHFGEQVFVVEDRMARRKTEFVDIWMPTKQDALNFGIHRAKIIILN